MSPLQTTGGKDEPNIVFMRKSQCEETEHTWFYHAYVLFVLHMSKSGETQKDTPILPCLLGK